MAMSVAEAANHLNVTPRQVQRLVAAGDLPAQRGVGDSWMLDGSAVRERARLGVGPGRTWNPSTAWAAMDLVATGSTARLRGSALSRLRRSMRSMSAEEFVRQAQGRSQARRVSQTRRRREALSGELRLTGASALADPNLARSLGLTPGVATDLEGYLVQSEWEHIAERYGLVPDVDGDVLIHVAGVEQPKITPLVVAVDLCLRGSVRERSSALSVLSRYLSAVGGPHDR